MTGAHQGTVTYARCGTCGTPMFPVLSRLPCGHDDVQLQQLDEVGVVYSWTESRLAGPDPEVMVMADFLDGMLRITAPLVTGTAEIGDLVVVVPAFDIPYRMARCG